VGRTESFGSVEADRGGFLRHALKSGGENIIGKKQKEGGAPQPSTGCALTFSLYTTPLCCYKRQQIFVISLMCGPVREPWADAFATGFGRRAKGKMTVARKLGILVFFGVPAIIGGGIVYAIIHDMTAVWVYEVILLLVAGAFIAR
jgi:hypothetical protein